MSESNIKIRINTDELIKGVDLFEKAIKQFQNSLNKVKFDSMPKMRCLIKIKNDISEKTNRSHIVAKYDVYTKKWVDTDGKQYNSADVICL